jgi:hypothetical protein
MATQNGVLELYLSGAWTSVPLYSAAGTKIFRGHPPDGSWPRPSRVECEINNDSLAYDPARPESALYGVAGRNTRCRYTCNGNWRTWAEASSWRPDKTPEHVSGAGRGRSWTSFVAEGVLRRIGMWTDPLRSPMYRTISARTTSVGHWPLEDGRDALLLANSSPIGSSGSWKGGVTLGESQAPLGAEQTVKTGANSTLAGRFDSASTTAGWQVCWTFQLPAIPGSGTYQNLMRWTTSNGYTWQVQVNNASYNFVVTDANGTGVYSGNVLFGAGAEPTQWITFRVRVVQSGGNVDMQPAWYPQNSAVLYGTSALFAGTVGGLRQWWQDGNAYVDGAHFCHVFGVTTVADSLLSASAVAAINGHLNEYAYDRFSRLCGELGITAFFIGAAADTQRMGPQQAATFLELLREIRETDDCRIDDERYDIGLTIRTRRALYNQTAALTLTWPGQVAIPFARILDDQATKNRVTVKNASGGEVTASLLSGPMSVQPSPAGVGEYKATIDVSVANPATQLTDISTWHLAKGTLERPRYEQVTVDLLANPSLEAAASAVREGDLIQITGAEPDPVLLLVDGIEDRIGAAEHTITFLTELYEPYRIGVYDDGTWRWDTRTTTLAAGATSSATSLSLTTVDLNDVLTQAGGSIPYDLMVEGERVRVTAMTAPAGTGPYTQTATVTRSINGVVKAQLAGARVFVYDSRRWGL